jgi:hypothetical protein
MLDARGVLDEPAGSSVIVRRSRHAVAALPVFGAAMARGKPASARQVVVCDSRKEVSHV